jgi:hypothetical protein
VFGGAIAGLVSISCGLRNSSGVIARKSQPERVPASAIVVRLSRSDDFSIVVIPLRLVAFLRFHLGGDTMSLTPIANPPGTLQSRHSRLAATRLLLPCLLGLLATTLGSAASTGVELFPKHFLLHPGEQIHYNVCPTAAVEAYLKGKLPRSEFRCLDAKFSTEDPRVLRLINATTIKNGEETAVDGVLEAAGSGRTHLVVRTPNSVQRFTITVAGVAQPSIIAVPHTTVKEIKAKEFLFVGHANLDGYDYTAAARPGIDRVVAEARKRGVPVVYWVSNEYPNWYTADRHPEYAFVSEGQEHEIHVDAERVTFSGGSFMFCVLRNAQMTLHGMLKREAQRINFAFPADAIWVEDMDRGDKQWYPTPPVVLTKLFARRTTDAQKYDEVVAPFLNRLVMEFPVLGLPRNPPTPPLSELLKDWSIVVRFGDRYERIYRRGNSDKTLFVDFQGV